MELPPALMTSETQQDRGRGERTRLRKGVKHLYPPETNEKCGGRSLKAVCDGHDLGYAS